VIFWDSSAVVPLVVKERQSQYCLELLSSDQEMLVWCLTKVEVVSALCRKLRDGALDQENFRRAKTRLQELLAHAHEVRAIDKVRARALRLLEVHPLRAADACQLAAALVATQEDPVKVHFLTFDKRLAEVAQKEGFTVNPTAL